MVTISREPIGYANGWRYEIIASVPHDRAMHLLDKYIRSGGGHASFGTYHKDVLHISLNDTDPEFAPHLAKVVEVCTELENTSIGKLETEINELQSKRIAMIKKNRGKYAKC